MAQGGDPLGTGMGGSDETIKGEFSQNGVDNPLSHQRGVISMARSMDPDSASSQFFICYADCSFLDGQYAAFGNVTEGMEVVDDFLQVPRSMGGDGAVSAPNSPIKMEKVEMIDPDENGLPRVKITMNNFLEGVK
ncbi:peptidylprolyl isomerase [Ruminococcus flavefaciens]